MVDETIDIDDIEAFISGLKTSFDLLDEESTHQGFQMQLAKAISALRVKKVAKIEPFLKDLSPKPKELKNFLLSKLGELKNILDSGNYKSSKKFKMVMEIAQLRERITNLKIF